MAYKAKIIAVNRNLEEVTISYQVLNDGDSVVEDNQSIVLTNSPSLSKIKMRLIDKVKKIQEAVELKEKCDPYINVSIPVD